MMTTTLEIRATIEPEQLEGGYIRYTSADLPGFRLLCEPSENPITLMESALREFMPPLLTAALKKKVTLKGLRIIPSSGALFGSELGSIAMEADVSTVS